MAFSPPFMNWSWKFNFKRNLNDREGKELAMLMSSIENLNIDELEEDKRKWKSEASGQYTCNPHFEKLCNDDSAGEFLPLKMIWKASIPPKFKSSCWPWHKEN